MQPITFFNRYTNRVETEKVYGEAFLKWSYTNPLGKLPLHFFVKRPFFSKWYGHKMDQPSSAKKITPFINDYDLQSDEFLEPLSSFKSFNQFFYRKLKKEARPIAKQDVVFPADGRHLGFENASQIKDFFVKGQSFDLRRLLADQELYDKFKNGALVLSRLCPVDYHRFHFPVAGIPSTTRMINGPLFSVSPIALRHNLKYLWQNKRVITSIQTPSLGAVATIEVGATCVGSIHQTFRPGNPIQKAAEKGYFSFGGSSTITLFEPGRVMLADDLMEHSAQQRELYAMMGDALATAK